MNRIFIDGQAGTTGLEIAERLASREDLELLQISDDKRKDSAARAELLKSADLAILCLPDEAAKEAVRLANGETRLLDASTAFRVDPNWTYGLPELEAQQRQAIANAQNVSNPGCYPQGFILLIRPLIKAGLLDNTVGLRCNAISGYSGGGRQMIEAFQAYDDTTADTLNSQSYALSLAHKHVPEMKTYSGTTVTPLFSPTVANYYKGMLVNIPLFRSELAGATREQVHACIEEAYEKEHFITVHELDAQDMLLDQKLVPTACNNTNRMDLMVFGNEDQLLLCARYDNLGKGASGAAVQNLNIMLGLPEHTGLQ